VFDRVMPTEPPPELLAPCRNCEKHYDHAAARMEGVPDGFCSLACLMQFNPLREAGPVGDLARAAYSAAHPVELGDAPARGFLEVRAELEADARPMRADDPPEMHEPDPWASLGIDELWENAHFARQRAQTMLADAGSMEREAMRRMRATGATRLALPGLGDKANVTLQREVTIDRRISVLRGLYALAEKGLLPEEDVKKAIWLQEPEPFWKTDLRRLKKLAEYGGEVEATIANGVVENVGGWKHVVEIPEPKR
jgi:hypothetical protein